MGICRAPLGLESICGLITQAVCSDLGRRISLRWRWEGKRIWRPASGGKGECAEGRNPVCRGAVGRAILATARRPPCGRSNRIWRQSRLARYILIRNPPFPTGTDRQRAAGTNPMSEKNTIDPSNSSTGFLRTFVAGLVVGGVGVLLLFIGVLAWFGLDFGRSGLRPAQWCFFFGLAADRRRRKAGALLLYPPGAFTDIRRRVHEGKSVRIHGLRGRYSWPV